MIDFISGWAQGLVVAVIIATIIEMILPEGNSKKFIKIVIGVFVLFQIISPVVQALGNNSSGDLNDILQLDKYQNQLVEYENQSSVLASTNEKSTREIYLNNVKIDMTSKLEEKGYTVHSIEIETKTEESYTIEKVSLNLEKANEEKEENKTTNYQEQQVAQNVIPINTIEEIQIQIGEKSSSEQIQQGEQGQEEKQDSSTEKNSKKLTSTQKKEVREYLSETYGVKEKNIEID